MTTGSLVSAAIWPAGRAYVRRSSRINELEVLSRLVGGRYLARLRLVLSLPTPEAELSVESLTMLARSRSAADRVSERLARALSHVPGSDRRSVALPL